MQPYAQILLYYSSKDHIPFLSLLPHSFPLFKLIIYWHLSSAFNWLSSSDHSFFRTALPHPFSHLCMGLIWSCCSDPSVLRFLHEQFLKNYFEKQGDSRLNNMAKLLGSPDLWSGIGNFEYMSKKRLKRYRIKDQSSKKYFNSITNFRTILQILCFFQILYTNAHYIGGGVKTLV